jgi:hypothetical protein
MHGPLRLFGSLLRKKSPEKKFSRKSKNISKQSGVQKKSPAKKSAKKDEVKKVKCVNLLGL